MAAEFDDFKYPDPIQGGDQPVTRQKGLPPAPSVSFDPAPPKDVIQGSVDIFTTRQSGNGVERFSDDGVLRVDRPIEGNTEFVDGPFMGLGEPAQPPGIERTNAPLPPRPAGFGDMAAAQQRAAIKAQAEALGFVVTDAPGIPDTKVQSPTPEQVALAREVHREEVAHGTDAAWALLHQRAAAQPPAIDVMQADQPGDAHDPRDKGSRPMVLDSLPVIKKRPVVPVVLPTPETRRVKAKAAPKGKK